MVPPVEIRLLRRYVCLFICLNYVYLCLSYDCFFYLPKKALFKLCFTSPGSLMEKKKYVSGISLCLSVSLSTSLLTLLQLFSSVGSSLAKGDQRLVEHEADRRAEGVRPHLRSQRLGNLLRFVDENFSL